MQSKGSVDSNFALHPALLAPSVVSPPNHNFHATLHPARSKENDDTYAHLGNPARAGVVFCSVQNKLGCEGCTVSDP